VTSCRELTDAQKRELKLKSGVRVETVEGAAARAGIHENDVILSVDNVEVTNAKQFETLMARFVIVRPIK